MVLTQETEGENSFDRWTAILHLVDILCCCAVLIPIVWQVNQLEKNMEQNDKRDEHEGDDEEREEEEEEEEVILAPFVINVCAFVLVRVIQVSCCERRRTAFY